MFERRLTCPHKDKDEDEGVARLGASRKNIFKPQNILSTQSHILSKLQVSPLNHKTRPSCLPKPLQPLTLGARQTL